LPRIRTTEAGTRFDRIAATLAALVILGLTAFLLVRNEAIADGQLFFALRVVLSFAVATLGATIPGFLNLDWKGSGLVIRAGGALALFVLTFVYTPAPPRVPDPPPLPSTTTFIAPGGVAANTINGSSITVNPGPGRVP